MTIIRPHPADNCRANTGSASPPLRRQARSESTGTRRSRRRSRSNTSMTNRGRRRWQAGRQPRSADRSRLRADPRMRECRRGRLSCPCRRCIETKSHRTCKGAEARGSRTDTTGHTEVRRRCTRLPPFRPLWLGTAWLRPRLAKAARRAGLGSPWSSSRTRSGWRPVAEVERESPRPMPTTARRRVCAGGRRHPTNRRFVRTGRAPSKSGPAAGVVRL